MRELILAYLKQLKLKNFTVSDELPFSNSGTEVYFKNLRRIYVDMDQYEVTAFIPLLNSPDIDQEVITVKAYFTTDAKQASAEYSQIVQLIRLAKDSIVIPHGFRKDATSITEYKNDLMLTTVEYTFTKLV